jgi:hypothetical protein
MQEPRERSVDALYERAAHEMVNRQYIAPGRAGKKYCRNLPGPGGPTYNHYCMHEYLQAVFEEDWHQVPRWALAGWIGFYAVFLIYAFTMHGGFLFIDFVNLIVHEGGHLLFGWFGPTLGIWGGTILQWLVPLLLAGYFFSQRQTTAFAFCLFFFFENWLYTATYMADARVMALPLVTAGDSDFVEHDWHTIFSSLGVLQYDTVIAAVVRALGWSGMVGTVTWLGWPGKSS